MPAGRAIRRGGLAAALVGLGAVLTPVAAVWGQAAPTPAAPPGSSFAGATQVLAVEVPVQVVRDGEPVRGLQAGDFEVWEGRRKLPLTGFEVLDLAAGAGSGPAGRPAGVPSVPAAARRHFLFLFDL